MRALVVDDNFVCRKVISKLLSEYAECDIAVNGKEAIAAFRLACENNEPYELICLDIVMPDMNGQEVLKEIRQFEYEQGILGFNSTKIIMTTALDDPENIKTAFREQCEAYIVKPIHREQLVEKLKEFGLVK